MKKDVSLYAVLKRILSELNSQVVEHGERVAYLYLKMSEYRNETDTIHQEKMMLACYTHDIGAYKTEKFLDLLKFDIDRPLEHCIYGYLFMKYFSPLQKDAEVLLYHHTYYSEHDKYQSPYIDDSILIHLLDRVDIFNMKHEDIGDVLWQIKNDSGRSFNPKDVEDFLAANEKYNMLEHLKDTTYRVDVRRFFNEPQRADRLMEDTVSMLTYEIDFKSEQTVIHTITIVQFAAILAEKFGMSAEEIRDIRFAALLHDLGKIKIPTHILEKPGRLSPEELHEMQKHILFTEDIIGDLFPHNIVQIASRHHERLDGSGYPNHLTAEDLTLSDRIVQVADVASALVQKRSYKESMDKETVISILTKEADNGKLDSSIISLFATHYDEIIVEVFEHSHTTIERYEGLQAEFQNYLMEYSEMQHDHLEEYGIFSLDKNIPLNRLI